MKRHYFSLVLLVALFLFNSDYPQSFTTTPFITIPGNNYDVDVLYISTYHNIISFICWVNQKDSVYTLYLRQTSPNAGRNIVISADTGQIANPNIAFASYLNFTAIRIGWQKHINNHWQILSRECISDSLTSIISITDSLNDNTNPGLNMMSVVWIQNGKLMYKFLDSVNATPDILDSLDCSNPNVAKFQSDHPAIIYEKGPIGNKQIIEANYITSFSSGSKWSFDKLSIGGNNINPRFGVDGLPSFQEFEKGVWKLVYQIFFLDTTKNISYNCENPDFYVLPDIITKKSNLPTPSFIVYDSDSLKNNKEIMMNTLMYYGKSDTAINLSSAEGNDYLPRISWFESLDTAYIAIYWTHDQNGKKDIWMAYSKFSAPSGVIDDPGNMTNSFVLNQNYPNPFNPSTVISWQLEKSGLVTLKIYDVIGNEITTLVNEYQNAGKHSVTFDTQQALKHNLSSGIYFYQLKAGSNITAKKMLYLK